MQERLHHVKERITRAALACGRNPDGIRLVAVSKTKPVSQVREAIRAGVTCLGENYIQEAREKIQALSDETVAWHFIGHLQRNKAKYAVQLFDLIHSVDSLRLARELDKQAAKYGKIQPVLVQVNVSGETTKSGVQTDQCVDLVRSIGGLGHLSVQGLMTLPPYFDQPERARPFFADLRRLRDRIAAADIPGVTMDALSMGMTGDFEAAIQEGATLVRIGTAIFGARA